MSTAHEPVREANFDSIVGPTHNYAGLSPGNVASSTNSGEVSRPREAALQGLAKMRALAEMGLLQGWLPPHPRPAFELLRENGLEGDDATLVSRAAAEAPHLLARATSSSFMWAANAATVAPAPDTEDGSSWFCGYDAKDIEHGPIAKVRLPGRVPSGFHATWVPQVQGP